MSAKNQYGLTPQQEEFAQYYVLLGRAAPAYRKAYNVGENTKPEVVWVKASELLRDGKVSVRVRDLQEQRNQHFAATKDKILRGVLYIADYDPREIMDDHGNVLPPEHWPEHIAKAVEGIDVFEEFQGKGANRQFIGYTKKIRFAKRLPAWRLLGLEQRMFVERSEVGEPGEFDNMTEEQIRESLKADREMLAALEKARTTTEQAVAKAVKKQKKAGESA